MRKPCKHRPPRPKLDVEIVRVTTRCRAVQICNDLQLKGYRTLILGGSGYTVKFWSTPWQSNHTDTPGLMPGSPKTLQSENASAHSTLNSS